jgi:hypothetical protein
MSDRRRHSTIPPHEIVRRELAEAQAKTKLLRKQLKISEDAAIEAHRSREASRYRRGDKS